MSKKAKIVLAVVLIAIVAAQFFGRGMGASYDAGYDYGYKEIMRDPILGPGNAEFISGVFRDWDAGFTISRLTPHDEDPKFVAGYKAGAQAAAKEVDERYR